MCSLGFLRQSLECRLSQALSDLEMKLKGFTNWMKKTTDEFRKQKMETGHSPSPL